MSAVRSRLCGTVLVVDGDSEARAQVSDLLRRAGYAAVEAASGEEGLEAAAEQSHVAVILEVNLPGISGYDVCRRLREAGNEAVIVFVSGERTESFDRVAGLLLGADDYLTKPFAPDELLARVQSVLRRAAPPASRRLSRLTPRELEVLDLLSSGRTQSEIAEELVISPKTVGSHLGHIFEKLGVRSRAQAVAVALRETPEQRDGLDPQPGRRDGHRADGRAPAG
jgi:DNA-binding response OmpR family regulator